MGRWTVLLLVVLQLVGGLVEGVGYQHMLLEQGIVVPVPGKEQQLPGLVTDRYP